ncbi:hypothetical protein [Methylobacterium gregans]|uniref:Uncharacterized protein n=1 Tax=Methylobacterium gregans TaxID=374424 RepID=A0AA37MA80_9HYPH|nr:hypothetical protein [Methylobacterium gregans]MDQ0521935.1 hypothetical protein [Methylobacterium gregans]GJD78031.1 hypothetical protein NBEOAGPD_1243 [Methylobacterium gregans]GLS52001.1 hypothetical protein GCM10007886_01830 [Methylobacterium gregans]
MRAALALVVLTMAGAPALAAPRAHQVPQPPLEHDPARPPASADSTLTATGSASGRRLRALDLDGLVPLRLRLTIPF